MDIIYCKGANGRYLRKGSEIVSVIVQEPTRNPLLFITQVLESPCYTITHLPTTAGLPFLLTLNEARSLARAIADFDWNFGREVYKQPFPHHPTLAKVGEICKKRKLAQRTAKRLS